MITHRTSGRARCHAASRIRSGCRRAGARGLFSSGKRRAFDSNRSQNCIPHAFKGAKCHPGPVAPTHNKKLTGTPPRLLPSHLLHAAAGCCAAGRGSEPAPMGPQSSQEPCPGQQRRCAWRSSTHTGSRQNGRLLVASALCILLMCPQVGCDTAAAMNYIT